MADVCGITWAPAAGRILAGDYTLSRGITPSIISLTCVPFTGQIPAVSDVTFTCGGTTLRFKDCAFSGKQANRSSAGTLWTVTLLDARWRWRFGMVVAHYNRLINHGLLGVTSTGDIPGEEKAQTKSARALAEFLLDEMGVDDFDAGALPNNDYPEVNWDYIRPAQALADLCDLYGLVVVFDPVTGKVTLATPGEGEDLPSDATMLSDDVTTAEPLKPEALRAICGPTQHEEEFELEAVALDVGGEIKALTDTSLTYYPEAGDFGADFLFLSGIPETEIDDPRDPSKKTTARKLAEESVWRWYRIKPPASGKIAGWRRDNSERATLPKLLPIGSELLEGYVFTDPNTKLIVAKKREASVRGIHCTDWKAMGATNSSADTTVAESFAIDNELGLVKFSQPVFKWGQSGDAGRIQVPTLYLRCIVYGDRYDQKTKDLGGPAGVEAVDCSHLTLKYRDGADVNKGDIDGKIDAILDRVAKQYDPQPSGSRMWAGLLETSLDGKRQQVTYSVGPAGATTQASVNSEHNPWVASEAQRRLMELNAVPTWRTDPQPD